MSTFDLTEAAVRFGVRRSVNLPSERIVGSSFPERPVLPDYAPVDEDHRLHPQDPYALAKSFGEQLMDAAVRRSDIRALSIRPSTVHDEDDSEADLGAQVRDPSDLSGNLWSCIDVHDLADALVARSPGRRRARPAPLRPAATAAAPPVTRPGCRARRRPSR